jgi:hypothetical protein
MLAAAAGSRTATALSPLLLDDLEEDGSEDDVVVNADGKEAGPDQHGSLLAISMEASSSMCRRAASARMALALCTSFRASSLAGRWSRRKDARRVEAHSADVRATVEDGDCGGGDAVDGEGEADVQHHRGPELEGR